MVIRGAILVLSFLLTTPCMMVPTETVANERLESTETTMTGSSILMVSRVFQNVKTCRKYTSLPCWSFLYKASNERPNSGDVDLYIRLRRLII